MSNPYKNSSAKATAYCTILINSSEGVTCDQVDEVLAPAGCGWPVTN